MGEQDLKVLKIGANSWWKW